MTSFDFSGTFRLDFPAVGYGDRGPCPSVCSSHALDPTHDLFSLDNTATDDVASVEIGRRGYEPSILGPRFVMESRNGTACGVHPPGPHSAAKVAQEIDAPPVPLLFVPCAREGAQ